MFRPAMTLAAVGVFGLVVWRLVLGLLLPLAIGLLGMAIKIAFWVAVVALAIWTFRRLLRRPEAAA